MIKVLTSLRLIAVGLIFILVLSPAYAMVINQSSELNSIIHELNTKYDFSIEQLKHWFAKVKIRQAVIDAARNPHEKLPWYRYRKLFVTDERTKEGADYYNQHQAELQLAQDHYGVDRFVILAIIGIETRYGKQLGRFPVLDSLTTQVLHHPRRKKFYKRELIEFLQLCREEGWNPNTIKGSYAGAMGIPQFIASSYRRFAVDFDQDNHRNLIGQNDDAIASVANYLARHGWKRGGRQVSEITHSVPALNRYASISLKPIHLVHTLAAEGISIESKNEVKVGVIKLDSGKAPQYLIAYKNFYVITSYNHSINYAMAVVELANRLRKNTIEN